MPSFCFFALDVTCLLVRKNSILVIYVLKQSHLSLIALFSLHLCHLIWAFRLFPYFFCQYFFFKYVNNDFQCNHLSGSHFGRGVSHYGTPGGTHHQWYLKCQCSCEITLMHIFTLSNFCRSSFSYDIKTSQDHLTWPFILNSSSYCYCYYFLRQ